MPNLPTVRPGQIWADCDKRHAGRFLKVIRTVLADGKAFAVCEKVDAAGRELQMEFKPTRILLSRFRDTATGYRLVKENANA